MVRVLERTAGRDPQRARLALFDALDEPITLHPEDGVLVAEIAYRAPLPLVGRVAENMLVAGARYGVCLLAFLADAWPRREPILRIRVRISVGDGLLATSGNNAQRSPTNR
jgi:hypothetical protein